MENALITSKLAEVSFLRLAEQCGFQLIDTSFIETLNWETLTSDDLKQMQERSMWQDHKKLFALRNDFTDQLVRYYQQYDRQHQSVAYSGAIVRHQKIQTQLGLECYQPTIQAMHQAFITFYDYIRDTLNDDIDYVILGHYELVHLLLGDKQTSEVMTWIAQRNISALTTALGVEHPLVQLLLTPTHEQLQQLNSRFDASHQIVATLNHWDNFFRSLGIQKLYLDITPQPPRSYYKGIFINAVLAKRQTTLNGGYYKETLEGFGLGLTL
ncbi:ATP phosphoribosyltransferase regulatory subunit [Staphylococcus americanisciuri]|uniref:ATP phosphoribosyltransferase regulatory subunit n=1 Tax=Staphylococcus americanisciuri TaxID=2973940 RepID=A0ABT2EZR3_9STAP|nr:ATP phosphoribosyltransferase regulatory subunit [Staphylococcus americanisciuri]MCS4485691.1 ATP phosphoribosyltransferase regulatory subunit [Staphylococcus americanisciuri]